MYSGVGDNTSRGCDICQLAGCRWQQPQLPPGRDQNDIDAHSWPHASYTTASLGRGMSVGFSKCQSIHLCWGGRSEVQNERSRGWDGRKERMGKEKCEVSVDKDSQDRHYCLAQRRRRHVSLLNHATRPFTAHLSRDAGKGAARDCPSQIRLWSKARWTGLLSHLRKEADLHAQQKGTSAKYEGDTSTCKLSDDV